MVRPPADRAGLARLQGDLHADVEITLAVERTSAAIHMGHDGPDLIMDFADVDSLERARRPHRD